MVPGDHTRNYTTLTDVTNQEEGGLRRSFAMLMKLAHKGLDFPFRLACNSRCVDRVDFGAIPCNRSFADLDRARHRALVDVQIYGSAR